MKRAEYLLAKLMKEILTFCIKLVLIFIITSIIGGIIYAITNTQEFSIQLAETGEKIADLTLPISIIGMIIYEIRRVWKYCNIVILNYNEKPEP